MAPRRRCGVTCIAGRPRASRAEAARCRSLARCRLVDGSGRVSGVAAWVAAPDDELADDGLAVGLVDRNRDAGGTCSVTGRCLAGGSGRRATGAVQVPGVDVAAAAVGGLDEEQVWFAVLVLDAVGLALGVDSPVRQTG